jgi:AraC family transcriptional regulator
VSLGRYAPETWIPRHRHERASLCVAFSGGYDEQLDRSSRRVDAGALVIHPEGEAHANRHAPVVTHLLTIELNPVALDLAGQVSPLFAESWHRAAPFVLPLAYRTLHEIEAVRAAPDLPTPDLVIDDLIWRMISAAAGDHMPDAGRPTWLLAVRDYLDVHFADGPTLTTLAEMAGVHPMHLTRSFRKTFRCSIGDFVRQRQAETALTWLADGRLGLADISVAAGFADQSHMTRRVRDLTGRPPGAWRRSLRV